MNGDFSRWTAPNAIARHYAGVLIEQGRPLSDADWNEGVEIQLYRSETALADIIGRAGTPKGEGGFAITPGAGGFRIGAGRYYLDGAMVENAAVVDYEDQGGDVSVAPITEAADDGDTVLVYVEATRRHVSAQLDSRLADPALGGIDTATRIKAAWRVGLEPVALGQAERDQLIAQAHCGKIPALDGWGPGTGIMAAGTVPPGELPDDSDCLIPPEAGYLSQENQLYRVQIIRGGTRATARFVWSRENASVEAALVRNAEGEFVLQGAIDDEALGFVSGGWVEIHDAADRFNARSGSLHRLTLTDGIATFAPGVGGFDQMVRPMVRRWDHTTNSSLGLPLTGGPIVLERGIQVEFSPGTYREGDYWVFEARAATGGIAWAPFPADDPEQPIPPMGWGFRRAPLALAELNDGALINIVDLRAEFPTLTCLEAEDIGFDDDACNLGADTVQDALEALCQRSSAGLCTIVVGNATELVNAVAKIPPGQSVRLCLRAGFFQLSERVLFENLGHVSVEGTGPQTVISVSGTEPALLFRGCKSVRVTDLSVNGGPTGVDRVDQRNGRLGAVTAVDCGDMSFERLRARCRAGLDRRAACISTLNTAGNPQVLVRDCTLKVGQSQIGIQIIGAGRAVVQNNTLSPVQVSADGVRARILADPVLVNRLRRDIVTFQGSRLFSGNVFLASRGGQDGTSVPLRGLFDARARQSFRPPNGRGSVTADVLPEVAVRLNRALERNRQSSISSVDELRQHLHNAILAAVRNRNGRARIGSRMMRLIPAGVLAFAPSAFMAQGIVIAGSRVGEAHVLDNRIAGASDGIRVAASSRGDRLPPDWRQRAPANRVQRTRIEGNVISVLPMTGRSRGHGIYLGHVDSVSVGQNCISGPVGFSPDPDIATPQFGIFQFGYRGPRLTITENTVSRLFHGYVVAPELSDDIFGIWRLRDNATDNVERPYVYASGVSVI